MHHQMTITRIYDAHLSQFLQLYFSIFAVLSAHILLLTATKCVFDIFICPILEGGIGMEQRDRPRVPK